MDLLFRQLFSADLLPYHEVTALAVTVAAVATPPLHNAPLTALGAVDVLRGRPLFGPGRNQWFRYRIRGRSSAASQPGTAACRGSPAKSNSTLKPSPSVSLAANGLPAFEVKPSIRSVRPFRSSCSTCFFASLRPATVFQIVSLQPSR